jgi:glyoxylase-like metal-dependent hydrolase (beta-lactamase superfamily II)
MREWVMERRRIGEHELYRVEEVSGPLLQQTQFLPDMTPEMMAAEKHWHEPRCFDSSTGMINLTIQSWVLKAGGRTILVDTCCGNHKPRARPVWNMLDTPYLDRLRAVGVEPESVDIVMCTHLHVDHCGWNTQLKDGRWVPTFPNASYVFSKTEHDYWESKSRVQPPERDFAAIYNDSVLPVVEAGKAVMISDGHELAHGMVLHMAHGHSPGQCYVDVRSKDETAFFVGDVLHTPMQIRYPELCTAADWDKDLARASRRRMLERAADDRALLVPAHFPAPYLGHVTRDADRFAFTFEGEGA